MSVTSSYRWAILGLMWLCQFAFAVIFQSIPPMLGILIDAFNISHAQAGMLMGLFSLPAIFLSLPGGVLVDRYGARIVGSATLLAMVVGTAIVALSSAYWLLGIGRLISGIGATVLLVVAPKVITSWFHDRDIGLSMGVFNTGMPVGTILSLNLMGVVAFGFGWQVPIWSTFAVSIITLFLFLVLYRRRNADEHIPAEPPALLSVLKETGWGIWYVGLAWALFNAAIISFFTYAPDYFIAQGEDIARAGRLASYPSWSSIVLIPFVGKLIDRIGRKWLFVTVGTGGMAILLYLMPGFTQHATLFSISIGVFAAILVPAIFSLPAELLPERITGFGFGIVGTALGIGVLSGPYIVGSLRDATGNYLLSFVAMATFAALGVIPMLLLKRHLGRTRKHTTGGEPGWEG
jgi:MFS family permease